jgi:hypothetical protein
MAVVISDDSDVKEPVRITMNEPAILVGLVNPHPPRWRSRDLMTLQPLFFKQIRENALKACQLPNCCRTPQERSGAPRNASNPSARFPVSLRSEPDKSQGVGLPLFVWNFEARALRREGAAVQRGRP